MKKLRKSLSFLLASTVLFSLFSASACQSNKSDESSLSESTSSESISESTSATTSSTSESTTETTAESTTTTESSETTVASDESSSSGVKVNWDMYRSPVKEQLDPVINRVSGEPSYDFIPSPDYGKIRFYCGSINHAFVNSTHTLGCIARDGRVICEPIFNEYDRLHYNYDDPENGYIVIRHQIASEVNADKEHLTFRKVGFLSLDGSIYSGLSYDDYYLDDHKKLIFITYTDDGALLTHYDYVTGKAEDPIKLHFDYRKIPQDFEFVRLINDRYLVFEPNYWIDSDDRYDDNQTTLIDGKTGKEIPTENNQYIIGDRLLKEVQPEESEEEYEESKDRTYILTDFSGNRIFEKNYRYFYFVGDERIMFRSHDGWDLFDLQGNQIGSLRQGDQYWRSETDTSIFYEFSKIYLEVYEMTESSSSYTTYVFDLDLKLIDSTEDKNASLLFDTIKVNDEYANKELENIVTGKTYEYGETSQVFKAGDFICVSTWHDIFTGDDREYSESIFLDPSDFHEVLKCEGEVKDWNNIECIIMTEGEDSYRVLDPSDLHVVREGTGKIDAFHDDIRNKDYVVIYEVKQISEFSTTETVKEVFDAKTGKDFFTNPPDQKYLSAMSSVDGISDGYLYSINYYPSDPMQIVINEKGEVVFLWNVFNSNDEHYEDDYWRVDGDDEPDIP